MIEVRARPLSSVVRDYVALTKPRVISLLLMTTLAAMFITPAGLPSLQLVMWTMVGGYLMAGGANAFNMAYDSDIDLLMGRTSKRPIPSGRITRGQAFAFSVALAVAASLIFLVFVNPLTAALALFGYVFYAFVYTTVLKRNSVQNIVIGGAAGAVPPMIGWAAVTGSLSWVPVWLFVIIFLWTPPHFWALAIMKRADYARACVPMMPVVKGDAETARQIWLYSWALVAASLVLVAFGAMGAVYLICALALGARFLFDARRLLKVQDKPTALRLYVYSLAYLALLFAAMVADRVAYTLFA